MYNYEYIEFDFSDVKMFESLKNVYDLIKESRNIHERKPEQFWLSIIPNYTVDYFKQSEEFRSWNFVNLINFLIEDLDVDYENIFKKQKDIGRLEFEANGYPYGGPDALIILLKSFKCNPFKVNDGADIYKIEWLTDFEFTFSQIEEGESIINDPQIKANSIENIRSENKSLFSGLWSLLQRLFK